MVVAYGPGVAATTAAASSLPWPEMLGGTRVEITDAAGVLWPAPLTFVSPGQVNYLLPAGAAPGMGKARVVREDGDGPGGYVLVRAVSPGLFTASQNARGPVIGIAGSGESGYRVSHCEEDGCTAVPIAIEAEPVALFGTGFRNARAVTAEIGGIPIPVLFAGAQGEYPGLDQVNLELGPALRGMGETDLILTADGQPANAVRIHVR